MIELSSRHWITFKTSKGNDAFRAHMVGRGKNLKFEVQAKRVIERKDGKRHEKWVTAFARAA